VFPPATPTEAIKLIRPQETLHELQERYAAQQLLQQQQDIQAKLDRPRTPGYGSIDSFLAHCDDD